MKRFLLLPVLFFLTTFAHAQGVRVGPNQVTQQGTIATATNAVIIPPGAIIAFCNAPANSVPCTNKATTYTDATLGTACPTSTQIVLDGTNTCVALPDAQENWGVWVAAGQYAYTISTPTGNFGPYYVTAGGSGGGGTPGGVTGNIQINSGAGSFAPLVPSGCLAGQATSGINANGVSQNCITPTGAPNGVAGDLQYTNGTIFQGAAGITTPDGNSLHIEGPAPFTRDVVSFGAQSHVTSTERTTGTIMSGSHTLTVGNALDFNKTNGIFIADAGPTSTQTQPTITSVGCFGPSEISFGTCGLTSRLYAVSRVDALGGYGPASTSYTFATGAATLNADNYNMGYGGTAGATTTEAIYVWAKVGAGAWYCLGQFLEPFGPTDDYFYFEDWGQTSACAPWIPSSPPASAGADPLISTITNISGTTFTLADAASNSVSGDYVYPDDSVAVKAAITAANNDGASGPQPSRAGEPCALFPAGGQFFISNLNLLDLFGGAPNGTLCVRQAGSLVVYNMPLLLTSGHTDWGGIANNQPAVTATFGTAFAALNQSSNNQVHDLYVTANHGNALIGNGPDFHYWNNGLLTNNADFAPMLLLGSGNVIFGEVDHNNFFPENLAGTPASIVLDCLQGGTSNTLNFHDNVMDFHTYKLQSEGNGGGGGNNCSVHNFESNFDEVENSWDNGSFNIDPGDAAQNYGIGIGQSVRVNQFENNDPNASYPTLEYDVQYTGGSTGIQNLFLTGVGGPYYSNNLTRAGTYNGPCNLLVGWTIVGANNGSYKGSNLGCDEGGFTNMPTDNGRGGVETDGDFYQKQGYNPGFTNPAFSIVAQRPYFFGTSITTSGSGGTLAAGTYWYEIAGCMTASNSANCTDHSYERSITTTGTTSTVTVYWTTQYPNLFDHCQIWRGTSQGGENAYQTTTCPYYSSTGPGYNSFTDTGSAGTSGTPSIYNTAYVYNVDAFGGEHAQTAIIGGTPASTLSSGASEEVKNGTLAADLGVDLLDTTTPIGVSSLTRFWSASSPHWPHFIPNNGHNEATAGLYGSLSPGDCVEVNTAAGELIDAGGACGAGGSGTVTTFSSGNLATGTQNLFTTSVATASTTPAQTFTLVNSPAHKFFGNNTGSSAAPDYETLGEGDLPNTTVFTDQNATFGAHNYIFSSATQFRVRNSAGLTTAANGDFGLDTTNHNFHGWNNGSDLLFPMVPIGTAVNGDCVTWVVSSSNVRQGDAGAACGSGSGPTLDTNGVNNTSQSLLNFVNTTGGNGIAFTNPSGGVESATLANTAGGGNSVPLCTITGSLTGTYLGGNSGGTCANLTPAITPNIQSGASYTIAQSDLGLPVFFTDNVSIAVTLNGPGSYTTNFYFCAKAEGTGTVTITPGSGTIDGNATLVLTTGEHACVYNNGTNFFSL